ncbi:hypothetical protein [Paraflavitalea pollutisoli]|uniref:hypothetical protein n=1 Tax=Paraflavitalea pollutisoli TaxID=3034143 RepID=UPI0023EC2DC1|nr:hypothetical protein [Paraflavitalea sp. H1-2-19X]
MNEKSLPIRSPGSSLFKIVAAFLLIVECVLLVGCADGKDRSRVKFPDLDTPSIAWSGTVEIPGATNLFPVFLDSVNRYQAGQPLPSFLFNYRLDLDYPWIGSDRDFSLRKRIFEDTDNIIFLKAVLQSKDNLLKKVVDRSDVPDSNYYRNIPDRESPNHELAKARLAELKKRK